ncbi:MAG: DMT family transporter [Geminicoccaceae bacterium]
MGLLLVMAAASLWATVGVATQLVPEAAAVPAEAMGLARMILAGPLLLGVAFLRSPRSALRLGRLMPLPLLQFALSSAVFQVCLFRCFALLGVTLAVFLTVCLPPVLAMLWALARGRSVMTSASLAAFVLATAGLLVISGAAFGGSAPAATPAGLSSALLASVAFVSMSLAARRLAERSPPILVAGTGLLASGLVILAMMALTAPSSLPVLTASLQSPPLLCLFAYLSVGPTALAYICYCRGIAACSSACAGLVASMIEPAVAALLAMWLLHETLTPTTCLGCALLAVAMVVLWWGDQRSRRAYPIARVLAPPAGAS